MSEAQSNEIRSTQVEAGNKLDTMNPICFSDISLAFLKLGSVLI